MHGLRILVLIVVLISEYALAFDSLKASICKGNYISDFGSRKDVKVDVSFSVITGAPISGGHAFAETWLVPALPNIRVLPSGYYLSVEIKDQGKETQATVYREIAEKSRLELNIPLRQLHDLDVSRHRGTLTLKEYNKGKPIAVLCRQEKTADNSDE